MRLCFVSKCVMIWWGFAERGKIMAFLSFDRGAAMYDATPIENMFLLEYLPSAQDDCLRVYLYARMLSLHPELGGGLEDPRGFTVSKEGTYGTASWMGEKERKEVLKLCPISQPDGILLGKRNGKAVCLPVDTRLNRHIAVFGASGTGKSRGLIRPALFGIIERGGIRHRHRQ